MRSFHIILFLRRETQTFHPEEQPAAAGVCAPLPGKAYSSVERRKPFTRKSPRRRCEFAPPSRESLISPSRDANLSPGRAAGASASLRPRSRESLILPLRGANPSPGKAAGGGVSLRPAPGKACYEVTVVKRRLQERFISRHGTFVFSCQHLERALI